MLRKLFKDTSPFVYLTIAADILIIILALTGIFPRRHLEPPEVKMVPNILCVAETEGEKETRCRPEEYWMGWVAQEGKEGSPATPPAGDRYLVMISSQAIRVFDFVTMLKKHPCWLPVPIRTFSFDRIHPHRIYGKFDQDYTLIYPFFYIADPREGRIIRINLEDGTFVTFRAPPYRRLNIPSRTIVLARNGLYQFYQTTDDFRPDRLLLTIPGGDLREGEEYKKKDIAFSGSGEFAGLRFRAMKDRPAAAGIYRREKESFREVPLEGGVSPSAGIDGIYFSGDGKTLVLDYRWHYRYLIFKYDDASGRFRYATSFEPAVSVNLKDCRIDESGSSLWFDLPASFSYAHVREGRLNRISDSPSLLSSPEHVFFDNFGKYIFIIKKEQGNCLLYKINL